MDSAITNSFTCAQALDIQSAFSKKTRKVGKQIRLSSEYAVMGLGGNHLLQSSPGMVQIYKPGGF